MFGKPAPGASEPLLQRPGERVAALAAPLPALPHPRKSVPGQDMSSCNSAGGPAALDFLEVLKSLLEYSLPWTNKMTGRMEGTRARVSALLSASPRQVAGRGGGRRARLLKVFQGCASSERPSESGSAGTERVVQLGGKAAAMD